MNRISLLLLLLLFSFIINFLFSLQTQDFFNSLELDFRIDTFLGAEYHPQREEKIITTREFFDWNAGMKFMYKPNINLWLNLSYKNEILEKAIILDETGIEYHNEKIRLAVLAEHYRIGHRSDIFKYNVLDKFYKQGIIENMKFQGFFFSYRKQNYIFVSRFGGNNFNTLIGEIELNYQKNNFTFKQYNLFIGRDPEFNLRSFSSGFEFQESFLIFCFYQIFSYKWLFEYPDEFLKEKATSFLEFIACLSPNIEIGANYLLSEYKKSNPQKKSQSQYLTKFHFKRNNLVLQYRISKIFSESIKELNTIYEFEVIPSWVIGINISYFFPELIDEYYQIGFQARINYSIH